MGIIEIAQLITGIATLVVASILIWQMVIQKKALDIAHNDADSSMSFQAVDQHTENQRWFQENCNDEMLKKMHKGLDYLSEKELNTLTVFVHNSFMTITTEWRLGRRNRLKDYYTYAFQQFGLLKYKASREILKNTYIKNINSDAMHHDLKDLIKEVYENLSDDKLPDPKEIK